MSKKGVLLLNYFYQLETDEDTTAGRWRNICLSYLLIISKSKTYKETLNSKNSIKCSKNTFFFFWTKAHR